MSDEAAWQPARLEQYGCEVENRPGTDTKAMRETSCIYVENKISLRKFRRNMFGGNMQLNCDEEKPENVEMKRNFQDS